MYFSACEHTVLWSVNCGDEMYLRTPLFQLHHQYFSPCSRATEDYRCRSRLLYQASPVTSNTASSLVHQTNYPRACHVRNGPSLNEEQDKSFIRLGNIKSSLSVITQLIWLQRDKKGAKSVSSLLHALDVWGNLQWRFKGIVHPKNKHWLKMY